MAGVIERISPASLDRLGYWAAVAAVGTVTLSALRLAGQFTVSDALFALALAVLVGARLWDRSLPSAVPWWLLAAAGGLLLSGLLVELLPPGTPSRIVSERKVSYDEVVAAGQGNLGVALRFAGALLLVPVVLAWAGSSERRVGKLVDAWLIFVAFNCVAAVIDYRGPDFAEMIHGDDRTSVNAGQADRLAGFTHQSTNLSLICAMALPVVMARLEHGSGRRRGAYLVLIGLLVGAILLSGSRAGLVTGVIAAVLMLAAQKRYRRRAVILLAACAALVPLAAASGLGAFQGADRLLGGGTAVASDSRHSLGMEQAFADIAARPLLGVGFEFVRSAHNIYLQPLQAGGPLALLAFLLFAWGTLRVAYVLMRDERLPPPARALARGLGVAFVVWLVTGLVQNSIFDRFLFIPTALLLALAVAHRPTAPADTPALVEEREPALPSRPAPTPA